MVTRNGCCRLLFPILPPKLRSCTASQGCFFFWGGGTKMAWLCLEKGTDNVGDGRSYKLQERRDETVCAQQHCPMAAMIGGKSWVAALQWLGP